MWLSLSLLLLLSLSSRFVTIPISVSTAPVPEYRQIPFSLSQYLNISVAQYPPRSLDVKISRPQYLNVTVSQYLVLRSSILHHNVSTSLNTSRSQCPNVSLPPSTAPPRCTFSRETIWFARISACWRRTRTGRRTSRVQNAAESWPATSALYCGACASRAS